MIKPYDNDLGKDPTYQAIILNHHRSETYIFDALANLLILADEAEEAVGPPATPNPLAELQRLVRGIRDVVGGPDSGLWAELLKARQ